MKFEGEMVDEIKENIPEAPHLKVKRFMEEYGLREEGCPGHHIRT